ncbi:hypothetical protein FQR65_LT11436 [Abscondita terminalis]|nr:hypothetical protein FQR65_LT11436 [Abscondita terminalis]
MLEFFLDDESLINFVKGCKWSIQRTKEKIDCFYSTRTLFPEYFNNRDPFNSQTQKVLKAGLFYPLPNKSRSDKSKICYVAFPALQDVTLAECVKVFFMTLDVLLNEDENFAEDGLQIIADYKNITLKMLGEFTPRVVKSYLLCLQAAYPARFRGYIGINIPNALEKVLNVILNSFINEKTRSKITLLGTISPGKLHKTMDKSMLPEELGGLNGSLPVIKEELKTKMESYKDWFLEDAKYCSNERLRINKLKYKDEEFGVDGSFRKLNVD